MNVLIVFNVDLFCFVLFKDTSYTDYDMLYMSGLMKIKLSLGERVVQDWGVVLDKKSSISF